MPLILRSYIDLPSVTQHELCAGSLQPAAVCPSSTVPARVPPHKAVVGKGRAIAARRASLAREQQPHGEPPADGTCTSSPQAPSSATRSPAARTNNRARNRPPSTAVTPAVPAPPRFNEAPEAGPPASHAQHAHVFSPSHLSAALGRGLESGSRVLDAMEADVNPLQGPAHSQCLQMSDASGAPEASSAGEAPASSMPSPSKPSGRKQRRSSQPGSTPGSSRSPHFRPLSAHGAATVAGPAHSSQPTAEHDVFTYLADEAGEPKTALPTRASARKPALHPEPSALPQHPVQPAGPEHGVRTRRKRPRSTEAFTTDPQDGATAASLTSASQQGGAQHQGRAAGASKRAAPGLCKICSARQMAPRGSSNGRADTCQFCGEAWKIIQRFRYNWPKLVAVWRPQLVEAAIAAKPVEFWQSEEWTGGGRKRNLENLLGADCFKSGGALGRALPSAAKLPDSHSGQPQASAATGMGPATAAEPAAAPSVTPVHSSASPRAALRRRAIGQPPARKRLRSAGSLNGRAGPSKPSSAGEQDATAAHTRAGARVRHYSRAV